MVGSRGWIGGGGFQKEGIKEAKNPTAFHMAPHFCRVASLPVAFPLLSAFQLSNGELHAFRSTGIAQAEQPTLNPAP